MKQRRRPQALNALGSAPEPERLAAEVAEVQCCKVSRPYRLALAVKPGFGLAGPFPCSLCGRARVSFCSAIHGVTLASPAHRACSGSAMPFCERLSILRRFHSVRLFHVGGRRASLGQVVSSGFVDLGPVPRGACPSRVWPARFLFARLGPAGPWLAREASFLAILRISLAIFAFLLLLLWVFRRSTDGHFSMLLIIWPIIRFDEVHTWRYRW